MNVQFYLFGYVCHARRNTRRHVEWYITSPSFTGPPAINGSEWGIDVAKQVSYSPTRSLAHQIVLSNAFQILAYTINNYLSNKNENKEFKGF